MILDAWRLSAGTLTALPWGAPRVVGPAVGRWAMLLGPLAVLPLAALVAGTGLAGGELGLPPLAVGLLAVGVLALGTRVLHWDGLSDVADGLTASYDRERSLAVMKSGTSGPAGVVAVVLVAGLQVAGLTPLLADWQGCLTAGVAVCVSRCALATVCARRVPSARPDGLGATVAGTVPVAVAVLWWLLAATALGVVAGWRGPVAVAVAAVVVVVLVMRTTARFGGMTGDVLGAAVELSFAALVVTLG